VNQLRVVTARRALVGLAALIVVGGFVLALLSGSGFGSLGAGSSGAYVPANQIVGSISGSAANSATGLGDMFTSMNNSPADNGYAVPGNTEIVGQQTTVTMMSTSTTTYASGGGTPPGMVSNVTQGSPSGAGGLIEFSSDLTIRTSAPEQTASGIVALAYSVGGYVAYQSTYSDSAFVVIRVPAAQYQQVLTQVKAMGIFVSETSNSNDVKVQYTDMNATLASLRTEQVALLRLLNQSTTINSTLAIETQLQQVNQQINDVESQILQTKTLVDYATLNVTVVESPQQVPLALTLSATPKNGTSPLSVTFNSQVKGGAQPYIVNYNFGDGYASEGQIVIHTYFQPGDYEVVVSATDQNGTVVQAMTTVKVAAAPTQSGLAVFLGNISGLFVNVIESIVEVAVVVLPLAAVAAAVIIPIQRHDRNQKGIKQSQ
jgi:PKD repeat protein